MDRRRYVRTVALAGAAAGFAGCTGEDDGDSTDEPTATEPEETTEETEAQTDDEGTETPTETAAEEPPSDPDQRVAVGDGLRFDPDAFEMSVGDTVLWEWEGGGHNIKYDEGDVPGGTDWTGTEGSRTTTYGEGHAHWHTFEVAGEYEYYCVPHRSSGMTGRFTVTE